MNELAREDLYSLEKYAEVRPQMRSEVMAHKIPRRIPLGESANLYFEDRLTMQYQIQEMLRIERIFEADAIQEELDTYNPLITSGSNLKATFMLEYSDPEVRAVELSKLVGIEEKVWVQAAGFDKVYPFCNEDLVERSTEEKTSAVHFMRFELDTEMISALKDGAALSMGIEHANYAAQMTLSDESRQALIQDLHA